MTRRINCQDVPRYVWRHAMNQETLLSTRVTVDREMATPYRHPMTVDVLLEPFLTKDGLLYEARLRIFGAVGDGLFDEIWDSLSQKITLPDPSLQVWDTRSKDTIYFSVKIDVTPEEVHEAVMDFLDERHDLTKFRVYHRPRDMSYLKRDYALLPHLLMVLRSTSRSEEAILRAVNASSFMRWLVIPYLDRTAQEIVNLLIEVIKDESQWQEVMTYLGTHGRVRFAWEAGCR